MREVNIDIFDSQILRNANAVCFTSNGIVTKNNRLVMGAGVAKLFRDSVPQVDLLAGKLVKQNGNVCQEVTSFFHEENGRQNSVSVVVFPTKNHFKDGADLSLILRSARRLREIIEKYHWQMVALPRPGVGLGGFKWEMVRDKLEPFLDNRVVIVYR